MILDPWYHRRTIYVCTIFLKEETIFMITNKVGSSTFTIVYPAHLPKPLRGFGVVILLIYLNTSNFIDYNSLFYHPVEVFWFSSVLSCVLYCFEIIDLLSQHGYVIVITFLFYFCYVFFTPDPMCCVLSNVYPLCVSNPSCLSEFKKKN